MTGLGIAAEKIFLRRWLIRTLRSHSAVTSHFGLPSDFRFFLSRPAGDVTRPFGWVSEHRVSDASADGVRGSEHLIDLLVLGSSLSSFAVQDAAESLVLAIEGAVTPVLVSPVIRIILSRAVFLRSFALEDGRELRALVRVRLLTEQ